METVWYVFLAVMITMYVILDGFDLGVGALHRVLARNDAERGEATGVIGPVWNGNEVWLIAGGGVLFLAFPLAYAAAFSGLYFGLILVLWLLESLEPRVRTRFDLTNQRSTRASRSFVSVNCGAVPASLLLAPAGARRRAGCSTRIRPGQRD